ncbi:MAG: hypothetical protein EZS28_038155 [Streblomastix strix]|uniref:Uncharacterized protein n=1 Tax=Streblomastix strix TaxID=222440 RepID=A0A5J4U7I1_9EUKA|nr:MAG: hypothetical protein EZS28_038155 [Streblomastix strix]
MNPYPALIRLLSHQNHDVVTDSDKGTKIQSKYALVFMGLNKFNLGEIEKDGFTIANLEEIEKDLIKFPGPVNI